VARSGAERVPRGPSASVAMIDLESPGAEVAAVEPVLPPPPLTIPAGVIPRRIAPEAAPEPTEGAEPSPPVEEAEIAPAPEAAADARVEGSSIVPLGEGGASAPESGAPGALVTVTPGPRAEPPLPVLRLFAEDGSGSPSLVLDDQSEHAE